MAIRGLLTTENGVLPWCVTHHPLSPVCGALWLMRGRVQVSQASKWLGHMLAV